ncbi:MAG: DUF427 domain-containing protein [Chloroflexota bacterium]
MGSITPVIPGPGQESVWSYPRPPRVETSTKRIRVLLNGEVIADSSRALRVLETSHPPVYYLPPDDLRAGSISPSPRRSVCEYKGVAHYVTVTAGSRVAVDAGWSYPAPQAGYELLAGYIAFYPGRMDACYVDGERVQAQAGDFYGGWITADIVGPFKGGSGTFGS